MPPRITWPQALAWRMERQLLDPIGDLQAVAVVRRLGGVQAHVLSSAVLAVRVRQQRSSPGEVAGALADGELIKTWAMRGTLHLLDPESAGTFLSLLAAGRGWERPSWVRTFGLGPDAMERLRVAVREALDGAVLTREALGAEVIRRPGLGHVADALRSGWGSVLKPLAYQGDLCFGPSQGNRPVAPGIARVWTYRDDEGVVLRVGSGDRLRSQTPAAAATRFDVGGPSWLQEWRGVRGLRRMRWASCLARVIAISEPATEDPVKESGRIPRDSALLHMFGSRCRPLRQRGSVARSSASSELAEEALSGFEGAV